MPEVTLIVADWCPVCPRAKELWTKMAAKFHFKYQEIDISSEAGSTLAKKHSILSVPATLINGEVVFRGVPSIAEAKEQLRKHYTQKAENA